MVIDLVKIDLPILAPATIRRDKQKMVDKKLKKIKKDLNK